jgi:transposase-like protein
MHLTGGKIPITGWKTAIPDIEFKFIWDYALDKCCSIRQSFYMKKNNGFKKLFADGGLTLVELAEHFASDEKAREYIERILWPNGPVCPHCGNSDQNQIWSIKPNKAKHIRAGLHRCVECNKEFTVTIGTIFEDSHIPLRKWLLAWYLICSSKKGISSLQLQRQLKLGSYRTALFLSHRIRFALKSDIFADKLSGVVEADECHVPVGSNPPEAKRATKHVKVFSMVERGGNGRVRSQVMPTVSGANLKQAVRDNVQVNSELHTDQHHAFKDLKGDFSHHTVKHGVGEFKRIEGHRIVTTASVESFFSLLRRGIIGTFHHVSEQHLPLYVSEFDHRHNCRKMSDGERTNAGLLKSVGKRLVYKTS